VNLALRDNAEVAARICAFFHDDFCV